MKSTVVGSYPVEVKNPTSAKDKLLKAFGSYDNYKQSIKDSVISQLDAGIDIISDGQVRGDMVSIFTQYIPGMKIEDSVKDYILTYKLDIDDLPWFMENYKQESRRIKDRIFAIMKEHIDETVQNADSMCYVLRIRVFASDEIDRTDKIGILEVAVGKMSNDEIIKYLRCIQLDMIADKLKGGKNWVVANAENTKVLDALVKHNKIQPVELAADKRHYKGIRFMRQ